MCPDLYQCPIPVGTRTHWSIHRHQARNHTSSSDEVLWSQESNYAANRCKFKRIGACLLQCEHQVYFGSKALTNFQIGYVAIELKTFVVSWAIKKILSFSVCNKICTWDRPEAIGNNISKMSESCNAKATENTRWPKHLPMTSLWNILQRWKQPVDRLPLKT